MKLKNFVWVIMGGLFLAGCGYFKQPASGPLINEDVKNVDMAAPVVNNIVSAPNNNSAEGLFLGLKNRNGYVVMYVLRNNEKITVVLYPKEKIPKTLAFLKKCMNRMVKVNLDAQNQVYEIKTVDSSINPSLEMASGRK